MRSVQLCIYRNQSSGKTELQDQVSKLLAMMEAQHLAPENDDDPQPQVFGVEASLSRSGARADYRMHRVRMKILVQLSDGLKQRVNSYHGWK